MRATFTRTQQTNICAVSSKHRNHKQPPVPPMTMHFCTESRRAPPAMSGRGCHLSMQHRQKTKPACCIYAMLQLPEEVLCHYCACPASVRASSKRRLSHHVPSAEHGSCHLGMQPLQLRYRRMRWCMSEHWPPLAALICHPCACPIRRRSDKTPA